MNIRGSRGNQSCTYTCWLLMRQRCNNPNCRAYPDYGGRGIKVCKRWNSFENFLEDMGTSPKGLTIERKDNDGDYTPDNCIWITQADNNKNKRPRKTSRYLTIEGRTQRVVDWANEMKLSRGLISRRIDALGWSEKEAVLTPVRTYKGKQCL